jgi:hypothetical protein
MSSKVASERQRWCAPMLAADYDSQATARK